MFAYIKLVSPDKNFDTVETSRIPKYRVPIDKKKHYKVAYGDTFKKALIIYVEETLEALNKRISAERPKIPPAYLQNSCTEDSDFDLKEKKRILSQRTLKVFLNKNFP